MAQEFSSQPKTSLKQKMLLIVFGMLLCLVLLEAGLRLAGFVYTVMNPIPKDRGAEYRILCVGESTTVGVGASDPSRFSYPHQLENMLREKFPGLKIQVFFDMSIGLNTTENLIKLPASVKKYKPQLVIFMVGINNWWNLDKSNILIFNRNKGFSELVLKTAVFLDRFRTYKLFKMIAYNTGIMKLSEAMPEPMRHQKNILSEFNSDDGAISRKDIDCYNEVYKICDPNIFSEVAFYDLREMVGLCQKQKIKAVICSYPSQERNEAFDELYDAQKRISSLFKCPFVDNYVVFKDLPDSTGYFSYDRTHPNDKGYHLLAKNIFGCILEGHFLETSLPEKTR